MPTTCLPTIWATQWIGLNMSGVGTGGGARVRDLYMGPQPVGRQNDWQTDMNENITFASPLTGGKTIVISAKV